ncbi:MAG: DNA pilot protein [Microviridae sp.]|nr:MAG: DNA pilot protein [Microviridae sp.]
MPLPAVAGALINAGGAAVGGVINSISQGRQNKKNRAFSEKMYDKQKVDNISFWSQQNDYNSPKAQMARFKEAGLNPNLIYGQGNSGNAGAISTPDVQAAPGRSPEWGNAITAAAGGFVNQFYDLAIKQAQTNNLQAQNEVIKQDAMLRGVQTRRGQFDLDFESELRPISAESRAEKLRQMKVGTDNSIQENIRRAIQSSTSVAEAAERILNMKQQRSNMGVDQLRMKLDMNRMQEQIRLMQKDGKLKDLEIGLRKQGINPQDPQWTRIVGQALSGNFDSPGLSTMAKNVWSWLKK